VNVKELMSKNIISISPDELISTALNEMKKNRVHQLVVDEKNMIVLKDIITKNIDPTSTKVKNIMRSVPSIDSNKEVEEAAQAIINSGLRSLPVKEKGKIVGIISETDLIKTISSNKTAMDISTKCVTVKADQTVAHVKSIMEKENISRIPIVDDNGNIVGIVGDFDMIKIFMGKQQMDGRGKQGSFYKPVIKSFDVSVKNIMRKPIAVRSDEKIKNIIKLLSENEEVIVLGKEYLGIITPKNLLELMISQPKKGVFVQITNIHDESNEAKSMVDRAVNEFLKKIGRMFDAVEYLFIYIEKHKKQGEKVKYTVSTRFSTPVGMFVSKSWDYNLVSATQDALDNLEREAKKKCEKHIEETRKMKFRRKL